MRTSHFAAALVVAGLLAGTMTACSNSRETPGEYIDDTAISTKVRAQLIDDRELNLFKIDVTTDKGIVQLSGVVSSAAIKARASQVAAATEGVKAVRNNLIVRP